MTEGGVDRAALVRRILELQDNDGRISWFDAGIYDPWNHVESAMGLAVAGRVEAARKALAHLRDTQHPDGSWDGDIGCAAPLDGENRYVLTDDVPSIHDTNFCAYPAVAVWHLALISTDTADLADNADMMNRAMDWVLAHQRTDGAFAWRAREPHEQLSDIGALRAGSASIYLSLECAIRTFDALDRPAEHLIAARARLGRSLRMSSEASWLDKRSFAMDWYYPVLCGALERAPARARLAADWRRFVQPRQGCRCVEDEPWVTAAETAELAIAAARVGADRAARHLLHMMEICVTAEGDLWMGRQTALNQPWPEERPSWTAGAALIAYDVVERRSAGSDLFLNALPETAPANAITRSATG